MRRSTKKVLIPALAVMTVFAMSLPAYAASSSRDTISSVKLEVDCGEEPQAGETVGSVDVKLKSPTEKVKISEAAEYYDTKESEWERGEVPVIRLELEVTDNDKYKFSSSTKVSVSGFHSDVKTKKVLDSGDGLRIDIKLRKVGGDLEAVDDLSWDGRTAWWEEVDDADKYEVRLYRGSRSITTVTTSSNRYNFYPYMTAAGDYTFKVRAISNSDGEKSEWTDESDEYYMNSSDVYSGTPPTNNTGSTSTGGPVSGGTGWVQDQFGWWYGLSDGNRVRSNWSYVDNNWFHFDANGYMETGWVFADNNWFYLNPISDGTRGAMKTGLQAIDGFWYYLNPISDGTRGARKTGYQLIDSKFYFFDTGNGAMWVNRTVPNGLWAGADGVLR